MKEMYGDLIELALDGQFDVIIHGCNCFCTMGAGIAKQIKKHFPEAYEADKEMKKGDEGKLGSYSYAKINDNLTVVNAYTQFGYWSSKSVSYDAVDEFFDRFANQRIYKEAKHIGIPLIGAGLAGGNWNVIREIIIQHDKDKKITLVRWNKK